MFTQLVEDVLKEQGEQPPAARDYNSSQCADKGLNTKLTPLGIDAASIDTFVKNAHALRALVSEKWGVLDGDPSRLSMSLSLSLHHHSINRSKFARTKTR